MSNDTTIGSRFIITLKGDRLDESFPFIIRDYHINKVLIRGQNMRDEKQLIHLIGEIKKTIREQTESEAFIILEYNHTTSQVLHTFMTPIAHPLALSATSDEGNAYSIGKLHGSELKNLGFHAIIAPSMELHSNVNRESTDMSFGNVKDVVSRFGIAMQIGYIDGGIIPILYNYPGKSAVYTEDEASIGINDKTIQELKENELYPFERAIEKGAKALLVAPYYYKAYSDEPIIASMSYQLISEYTREELGYEGLIISPFVDDESLLNHIPLERIAIESLKSGCDLILISSHYENIQRVYASIEESLDTSYLSSTLHQESLSRIESTTSNTSFDVEIDKASHSAIVKAIIERSITLLHSTDGTIPPLGDNPIFLSKKSEGLSFAFWCKENIGGEAFLFEEEIESSEINRLIEEASDNSSIIIALKNGYAHPKELSLANSLGATGIPTIAVSLEDPYDVLFLQPSICSIAIYEESLYSYEGLRKVLTGERNATGNLSIHW
ncbi:MAG: hypothetical protein EOM67_07650 [Spirochaetia bacterium]|nr:hypothetical protein [Spirochaetia bacterium]